MIKDNQKLLNRFHVLIDAVLIAISFVLTYYIRFESILAYRIYWLHPSNYWDDIATFSKMLWFVIPGYLISYAFCKMYGSKRSKSKRLELWNIIKANVMGLAYFTIVLVIMKKDMKYMRAFFLIFFIVNTLLDYIFRLIVKAILKSMRKRGYNLKHVVLVGYSRTTEKYINRILSNPEWGYHIHGILDDNHEKGFDYRGIKVMDTISELPAYLETNKFDEIAITLSIDEYGKLERIVNECEKSGVHTQFIPDYNNIIPTRPYTEDYNGLPVINIRRVPLSNGWNALIKRMMDIAGSLVCIVLFSIPMLITAIIIKATSKGPLIFKQTRVGLHNREFSMYKFRSMEVQNEAKEKKAWTTKNDPRVTPIGRFIRKTSIDELPQLFNVLKGDMSLVGPRPERPFFVEKFKEEIPRYMIKHQVRPGITGWAQVNGYRGDTSIRLRIEHDLFYIENWSIGFDIKILFLTIFKGFVNKNAY